MKSEHAEMKLDIETHDEKLGQPHLTPTLAKDNKLKDSFDPLRLEEKAPSSEEDPLRSRTLKKEAERLSQSAAKGDWNEVQKICQANWLFNIPITKLGDTVLHLAVYNKQENIFELLIQQFSSGSLHEISYLKKKNAKGDTPLHHAALVGSEKMCRIITEFHPTTLLSVPNDEGETPLFSAALHGHKDAFLYLHSICGPEERSNYCKRSNGDSILHCAISEEHYELCLIILRRYKDLVNHRNNFGMTPLHLLASKPSAFKSGSNLRWFESIIYHSFSTTDEELISRADDQNLERERVTHGAFDRNGSKKAVSEVDAEDPERHHFTWGEPLKNAKDVRMTKERHTWSVLIMNELLKDAEMYPIPPSSVRQSGDKKLEKEKEKEGDTEPTEVILMAAKNGITEMVRKILEIYPVAMYDVDKDQKNIVLLTVEHKQPCVYELLLSLKKKNVIRDSLFSEVDNKGNSVLHLAATNAEFNWPVPGAASQMQWEIRWFEYIKNSMERSLLPLLNKKGQTPEEIFTKTHEDLVKQGGDWLSSTANACSVVAGLFVTSTFSTATNLPEVVEGNKHSEASKIFAGSSFVSFYTSLVAVVMFLSILTSGYREKDFRRALPWKLLLGLTAFYMSIASTLVSFTTGHFFIFRNQLKSVSSTSYTVAYALVTLFSMAVFPLYFHLVWATLKKVPQRKYRIATRIAVLSKILSERLGNWDLIYGLWMLVTESCSSSSTLDFRWNGSKRVAHGILKTISFFYVFGERVLPQQTLTSLILLSGSRIGHDVKHCSDTAVGHETETQYGDWMRAGWNSKGGPSRSRTTSSSGRTATAEGTDGGGMGASVNTMGTSEPDSLGETNGSNTNPALGSAQGVSTEKNLTSMLLQMADTQVGWDKTESLNLKVMEEAKGTSRDCGRKETSHSSLAPKEGSLDECSIVGLMQEFKGKAHEATSPLRQKLDCKCKGVATPPVQGPTKDNKQKKKPSLKKIARQVAQHQSQAFDTEMLNSDVGVGSKRPVTLDHTNDLEGVSEAPHIAYRTEYFNGENIKVKLHCCF
nr:e3 ubiquitin-protein ligase mib2 [Quercus suber]